jgi:hypothetical protein
MKQILYYPTYGEILTIERAARRAQAVEMVRLAALAASKLKALSRRLGTVLSRTLALPPVPTARGGPGRVGVRAKRASIIEELGASLPAELRVRYAGELAAAARVEPLIDLGLGAWDFTVRALARVFEGVARGLHAGARSLDVAARRLTPTQ